jgi:hypothetical protein
MSACKCVVSASFPPFDTILFCCVCYFIFYYDLFYRILNLEEQLRDMDLKAEERLTEERKKHQELMVWNRIL